MKIFRNSDLDNFLEDKYDEARDLQHILYNTEQDMLRLRTQLDSSLERNDELDKSIQTISALKNTVESKFKELETIYNSTFEEVLQLKLELHTASKVSNKLAAEQAETAAKLNKEKDFNNVLKDDLSFLQNKLKDKQKKSDSLENELTRTKVTSQELT